MTLYESAVREFFNTDITEKQRGTEIIFYSVLILDNKVAKTSLSRISNFISYSMIRSMILPDCLFLRMSFLVP